MLTGNGAIGRIRQATNATVILIAHCGKDPSKGIRGNSGFEGNTDAILFVEADHKRGLIRVTVEKMRDGPTGHSIYFAVDPDPNVVPVPVQITEADYVARSAAPVPSKNAQDGLDRRERTRAALVAAGALGSLSAGLPDEEAGKLTGHSRGSMRDARKRAWSAGLWASDDDGVARWFVEDERAKG
jgi:hypothetical protein